MTTIPAELAQVQADAAQAFATAAMAASEAPTPAAAAPSDPAPASPAPPDPNAAPAPTQAAPQPTDPASAPEPPAAAATPGKTFTMDPATLNPEAKRFLEMQGWDGQSPLTPDLIVKGLSRGLEFNNRLGKNGDGAPAPGADPSKTAPPAPAAPPADAAEQIEAQIAQAQDADPECSQIVSEYAAAEKQLKDLGSEGLPDSMIGKLYADLEFNKRLLETPDIKENPLRYDEVLRLVREQSLELKSLRADRSVARNDSQALAARYRERAGAIDSHIRGDIRRTAAINSRAEELARQWPSLVQAVADEAKIPKSLQAEFFEDILQHFVLSQRAGEKITDLKGFLSTFAARTAKRLDSYHVIKAGEYGKLAHERTQTVTPDSENRPGGAPATSAKKAPESLTELYAELDAERQAGARG